MYIGVDGGGTKTAFALVFANGELYRTVVTGCTNWNSVGKESAKTELIKGLTRLMDCCEVTAFDIHTACFSLSGVSTNEEKSVIRGWVHDILPNSNILVYEDVIAALASGTGGQLKGITCIAGTGMNCYGKYQDREAYAGGMGPLLGDEGGGVFIGEQVLAACARANDGRGPHTPLLAELLKKISVKSFRDLVPWRYHSSRTFAEIADLATLAFDNAKSDPVSKEIIQKCANGLAHAIETVVNKLAIETGDAITVVTAGSLWKNTMLLQMVKERIAKACGDQVFLVKPSYEPSHAAALVGLRVSTSKDIHVKPSIQEGEMETLREIFTESIPFVITSVAAIAVYMLMRKLKVLR